MKKVLIVEDDLLIAMVNQIAIENAGYQVVDSVSTGVDAISSVKEFKPDVVLMDISLEGDLDGIETMSKIREFSNVEVVYVTGNADKSVKERAKKEGYVAFLNKPITAEKLGKTLSQNRQLRQAN